MEKLLTVSVAAYNGAATLARALDSCLTDTPETLEVLVVDDGSADDTARIAGEYAARWPHTFRLIQKENGGYGTTIQRALLEAQGRYFRTLDCDDLFAPGSLAALLAFLADCEADAVYTDYCTECGTDFRRFAVCEGTDPTRTYTFADLEGRALCMEMHALTFRTQALRAADMALPAHCSYTDMLYTFCGMAQAATIRFCPVLAYRYQLGREGQTVSLESYRRHTADYIRVTFAVLEQANAQPDGTARGRVLQARARDIAQYQIELFLRFPPSGAVQRELTEYDRALRSRFPGIAAQMQNKNTRLLRASGYALYPLLHAWASHKKD